MNVMDSDSRLKQDVANLPDALTKIAALRPVQFHWKSDPTGIYQAGFLAQEYITQFPDYTLNTDDGVSPISAMAAWQIDTTPILPYLVGATKELKTLVEALTTSLASLSSTVSSQGTTITSHTGSIAANVASLATQAAAIAVLEGTVGFSPTKTSATMAAVTAAASGTPKTVGTLTNLPAGKYLLFAKIAAISQGVPVTMGPSEVSISTTTNVHNDANKVRDFGSLLGTSRLNASNAAWLDLESPTTVYAVFSTLWTGTAAPVTVAADSEFFAIKIGNH